MADFCAAGFGMGDFCAGDSCVAGFCVGRLTRSRDLAASAKDTFSTTQDEGGLRTSAGFAGGGGSLNRGVSVPRFRVLTGVGAAKVNPVLCWTEDRTVEWPEDEEWCLEARSKVLASTRSSSFSLSQSE